MDWDKIATQDDPETTPSHLLEPYSYLALLPLANRNVRRLFIHAFNNAYFHIESSQILTAIEDTIAVLHNLSLLIDDIEDSLELRRGSTTAHVKYGVPLTINCANSMYFSAMNTALSVLPLAFALTHPTTSIGDFTAATLRILILEMLNLHRGQGTDIYWRDFSSAEQLPLIDDYINMVKHKTGGLFRLSSRLLAQCSDRAQSSMVIPVTNLLGIMYQIRDDYLNITDKSYAHLKGVAGEDLVEGKLSLPILHCLHQKREGPLHHYIFDLSHHERVDLVDKRQECIQYMHDAGLLQYTLDMLHECRKELHKMINDDALVDRDSASVLLDIVNSLCTVD